MTNNFNSDLDMIMLSIANSKERTLEDWKSVFATADPRLELTKTQPLTGSNAHCD